MPTAGSHGPWDVAILFLRLSGLVLVVALISGCTSNSKSNASDTDLKSECTDSRFAESKILAVAGKDPNDARLLVGQLCRLRLSQRSDAERVSAVGFSGGKTVVADARKEVGYLDHLELFDDGSLRPLLGKEPVRGFSPAVNRAGDVLFLGFRDAEDNTSVYQVKHLQAGGTEVKVLYETKNPVSPPTWGPEGQWAVLEQTSGTSPSRLVLSDANSEIVLRESPISDAVRVLWGPEYLAVSNDTLFLDRERETVVVDVSGRLVTKFLGSGALAWSPSGRYLLMRVQEELVVADKEQNWDRTPLGRSNRGVLIDAEWINE